MSRLPPSVNFHLLKACNMSCRFCFDTFEDVVRDVGFGQLPREEGLRLIAILAAAFEKVTFVGGEPTLCPWLPELVKTAKDRGATTMLVTNGSRIDEQSLASFEGALDWVTLSIDSACLAANLATGRAVRGRAIGAERYAEIADEVRAARMRLKVNTVVTSENVSEDLSPLIRRLGPERWKIFEVLPVRGQNDGAVEPLVVTPTQFAAFVARHAGLANDGIEVVPEDNAAMTGSYAMVDPAGRFFDNTSGGYRYSPSILSVGLQAAWESVEFDLVRFTRRGGDYDW